MSKGESVEYSWNANPWLSEETQAPFPESVLLSPNTFPKHHLQNAGYTMIIQVKKKYIFFFFTDNRKHLEKDCLPQEEKKSKSKVTLKGA